MFVLSLQPEMSQNSGVSDSVMNELPYEESPIGLWL